MPRIADLPDLFASPRSRSWLYFAMAFAAPLLVYAGLWVLGSSSSKLGGAVHYGLLWPLLMGVSIVVSITLFSAAFFAAFSAYASSSRPRSLARSLEFFGVGLPFVAMCADFIALVVLKLTI